jgi:hypothetical protein
MIFQDCLFWTEKLLALALIQQIIEQFFLDQCFSLSGAWKWKTTARDFQFSSSFLDVLFGRWIPHPVFSALRILACLALFLTPCWQITAFLFLTNYLLLVRWRGNFNGGSDHMTLILLGGLLVAQLGGNNSWAVGGFLYIGIQSILSYFIGGWVKVRRSNWRNGKALKTFIGLSSYQASSITKQLSDTPGLLLLASWLGMIFELSAPAALFLPSYTWCFLLMGAGFHLINFYLFGLNRFFFVWITTYPSVLMTTLFISSLS